MIRSLLLACLLSIAACASTTPADSTFSVKVTVINDSLEPVKVYFVEPSGWRTRLGWTEAISRNTFRIARGALGSGRFLVDPTGSAPYITDAVLFGPDQQLELHVGNHAAFTYATVRR